MNMSSVTPAASLAAPPAADATESGVDAPASGFDILLAAHADTQTERAARDTQDAGDDGPDTPCDADPAVNAEDPKAKTDQTVDAEGLAAQLAAQAAPPATPLPLPEPEPPAGDQLDSAAVLAAAADATNPVEPDPADTPAPPPPATDPVDATLAALDLAPATLDPDLTALLVATASNDTAVPSIASVPIPSFLEDQAAPVHAGDTSDPPPATAPIGPPPGIAMNEPGRPDRPRSAPADTGSVGFAPASGPAAVTSNPAAVNAEAAAATAPAIPPPPAEQLVSILSPLRTSPNGTYTLRLELKPVELGRVEMRVEMRDGVLHASIHADRDSSAQLVRASLNELREQLAAEGVRTGSLTVSDNALGSSGREANTRQAQGDSSRRGNAHDPVFGDEPQRPTPGDVAPTIDSDTTSLLDVRV